MIAPLADRAAEDKIPLFLLGDVFDHWFGNPGLTFGFQKPVIEHSLKEKAPGRGLSCMTSVAHRGRLGQVCS